MTGGHPEPEDRTEASGRLPRSLEGRTLLILIGSHLASAPRPQKEARALREAGARVLIRGSWWSPSLAEEDLALAQAMGADFRAVVDLRGRRGLPARLRERLSRESYLRFGLVGPRAFGRGAPELLREARRIDADLTMVHSEAGLWVAGRLLAEGRRVGVDFEDWFSRDLPEADHAARPVGALRELERMLVRRAHCTLTTTRAMAEALAADAGTARTPVAIPNAFPARERETARHRRQDARDEGAVSFHWFSQTVGPGRGLEVLAQALPRLRGEWRLSLRGVLDGHRAWYEQAFPRTLRSRVQLLDPVPNADLLARTMAHDVGLALIDPYCANKELTASNKLFAYLRAGLAVIATRTPGQDEVMASCPEAGISVAPQDPEDLAAAMQRMIDEPSRLAGFKAAASAAAATTWDWDRHAPTLVEALAEGLVRPAGRAAGTPGPGQAPR